MSDELIDRLYCGDALQVLKTMPDEIVDLVVTSPPYADSRKKTYGGINPERYADWFLPITSELKRVLKPTGTVVINIKERVVEGERHPYVLDIIQGMRQRHWLWTEEFIWHKRNSYPGKWRDRFRDAWERCLQFNKMRNFAIYQEEVKVPIGDWAKTRLQHLSETDRKRDNSKVKSGFGKNVSNWVGRDMVFPTNVLHFATETRNRGHSAAFPEALPAWFIRLFTKPGDLVLDPFVGSGTTAIVAKKLGRHYIGIDLLKQYVDLAQLRLDDVESLLNSSGPPSEDDATALECNDNGGVVMKPDGHLDGATLLAGGVDRSPTPNGVAAAPINGYDTHARSDRE